MKPRVFAILAACSLGLGGFGMGMAGWANADNILGRYPGAIRQESQFFDLPAATRGVIERQAVYETADAPSTTGRWYAARLHIAPPSETYDGRNCAWLASEQHFYWLRRDLSVSLCAEPHGTHVVIHETITVEP